VELSPTEAKVQRAEASVHIVAFAVETLKSQLPAEYVAWPDALRDALPYWLESQPFESWSPQVRRFAAGKFQKLADDTQELAWEPATHNKAAVRSWLREAEPFRDAELTFRLDAVLSLAAFHPGVATAGRKTPLIESTGSAHVPSSNAERARVVAMANFLAGLSAQQRKALFLNNMCLPVSRLSREQQVVFSIFFGDGAKINGVPIQQMPDAQFALDFQWKAYARRTVQGEQQFFEVYLARPFDHSAKWPAEEAIEVQPQAAEAR
jgi:hypothetical protein